jgi:creatinine amidohydrolase
VVTPELAALTWEEARDRLAGAVAILPIGATEAHGPHLPLGTDVVIAEAMARAAADLLESRGRPAIVLPSLAYSPAPFAAGFAGTISLRPPTLTALVLDIARSLAAHGIRALAIANAHLDPDHLAALAAAAETPPEAGLPAIVFPNLTRRPWGARLTEEFRSGACHAGRFEGSVVLAERPELVREAVRAGLPPNPVSLSEAIRAGAGTFEEAGGPRAYFGDPAAATAEEGRDTVATLAGIVADAVDQALADRA